MTRARLSRARRAARVQMLMVPAPMISAVSSSRGRLRMTGCRAEQKGSTRRAFSSLTLSGTWNNWERWATK